MCLLVQGKFSNCVCVCGWSHMHLQACMSGQDYFQFSYWLETSTLPGLRCWLTGLLSLTLPPLPPTCPWLQASTAGLPAWKISLWWAWGDWRRGRLGLWRGWKPQEEQHALTDRAWHWKGLQPRPGTFDWPEDCIPYPSVFQASMDGAVFHMQSPSQVQSAPNKITYHTAEFWSTNLQSHSWFVSL